MEINALILLYLDAMKWTNMVGAARLTELDALLGKPMVQVFAAQSLFLNVTFQPIQQNASNATACVLLAQEEQQTNAFLVLHTWD